MESWVRSVSTAPWSEGIRWVARSTPGYALARPETRARASLGRGRSSVPSHVSSRDAAPCVESDRHPAGQTDEAESEARSEEYESFRRGRHHHSITGADRRAGGRRSRQTYVDTSTAELKTIISVWGFRSEFLLRDADLAKIKAPTQ